MSDEWQRLVEMKKSPITGWHGVHEQRNNLNSGSGFQLKKGCLKRISQL